MVIEGFWLATERIITLLLSLASGVIVARHLGPTASGALAYAYGIQTLALPFITLALEPVIVREISSGTNRWKLLDAYWTFITISSIVATAVVVILALRQPWLSDGQIALLCVGTTFPFARVTAIEWLFRADRKQRQLSRLHVLKEIAINICRGSLAFARATFSAFAALVVVQSIVTWLINLYIGKKEYSRLPRWNIQSLRESKSLFLEALPLLLSAISTAIFSRVDLVMVEHQLGMTEAGIYSAATRIIEVFIIIPAFLNQLLTPSYARWITNEPSRFRRNSRWIELGALTCAITICALLIISAALTVDLLFGPKFAAAVPVLKSLSFSLPPIFILSLLANRMVVAGKGRQVLISIFSGAVVNVGLNWIWIPSKGLTGAAHATIVSMVFACASILYFELRSTSKNDSSDSKKNKFTP